MGTLIQDVYKRQRDERQIKAQAQKIYLAENVAAARRAFEPVSYTHLDVYKRQRCSEAWRATVSFLLLDQFHAAI